MQRERLHNEQELLTKVADGDDNAYRQLYLHYWDLIYSTALHFTKQPDLSEDMAQEVFAKIWIRRKKLREVERFDSYLYIVARNLILDKLRKQVYAGESSDYFEAYFTDPDADPGSQLEFKEFDHLIQQGIDQLPQQQQTAFRLSRFKGLSHEEIAVQMGLSKRTVKNYIVSAILSLRKHLDDHKDQLPIYLWVALFLGD